MGGKANVQTEERGPSISCLSHGSGGRGGGGGEGGSRSHFVQLTRRCERSPGGRRPQPKKGIAKFGLGRNRGRRLCSCAICEPAEGAGSGRPLLGWRGCGPTLRGAFVLKDAPAVAAGFGPVQCPVRGDGAAVGCAPRVRRGCAARAGPGGGCSGRQASGGGEVVGTSRALVQFTFVRGESLKGAQGY